MPEQAHSGRLMVYFPDADLCDGSAEIETEGWFDVFNCPPWDTWVGFFRDAGPSTDSTSNYLVAWVPPVFVDLVAHGIEVNPEQCIRWLDDTECSLRHRLAGTTPSRGSLARLLRRR